MVMQYHVYIYRYWCFFCQVQRVAEWRVGQIYPGYKTKYYSFNGFLFHFVLLLNSNRVTKQILDPICNLNLLCNWPLLCYLVLEVKEEEFSYPDIDLLKTLVGIIVWPWCLYNKVVLHFSCDVQPWASNNKFTSI